MSELKSVEQQIKLAAAKNAWAAVNALPEDVREYVTGVIDTLQYVAPGTNVRQLDGMIEMIEGVVSCDSKNGTIQSEKTVLLDQIQLLVDAD